MARYDNTKRKYISKKNKYVFETTIYGHVDEKNNDIYLISQDGDRLDMLAQQYYGNTDLWWYIGRVNHINTLNIPAGTSLRIPAKVSSVIK